LSANDAAHFAASIAFAPPYRPTSRASRAAVLSAILGGHLLGVIAMLSIGSAVIRVVSPPLQVEIIAEPPRPRPELPVKAVPLPQMRMPEVVIPEPPRFETLQAIQLVESKPAPPPPPPPPKTPVVAAAAVPVVAPPRFDLAYLNNPPPSYPVFAKRAREQGKVLLRVQVDSAGNVVDLDVHESSGFERLDKAALAAVRRWRFVPARSGERAVAGVALVPITFQLES
jgi:protein TonB